MKDVEKAIAILCSALDIDNKQRFYFLSKYIEERGLTIKELANQFNVFFNKEESEIIQYIKANDELIENVDIYSKVELINYIKSWFWDYLYPEKMFSKEKIELLNSTVKHILKEYVLNDGWMFSYDLFEELKKEDQFKDLEYYNLWKISFKKLNIERKPVENKDREIGYLRYHKIVT